MSRGRFSIDAIFRAKDRMSRIVGKIQGRFEKLERVATLKIRSIDRAFGKMHRMMARSAIVVGAAAAGIGAGLRSIITSGADFEQAISAVGAVSLQSRDEIADLEKRARELGASTTFTATEVANAMELMGRAGFSNAQILSGIEGVLAAAAAEGEEIAVVADHVSNALKGMGLEASEATRVADVLALASARTNSSISSLGESLTTVAPKARQLNIPLEQVVAAVAQLQDVGLDASTAGTALKAMLSKLSKPSKLVVDDMARLGLSVKSFKDAKGDMLPLEQVLAKMVKATKRAGGNFDQSAFLARMFGLETETAAMSMLKLAEEGKLQDLTKELEGAEGKAREMAELRLDNVRGDWEKFTGEVEDVKIALFDLEKGPLRDTIRGWTRWVEANRGLILTRTEEFLVMLSENLPEIVTWLTRIGKALVVFYTLAAAVKVAQVALLTYRGTVIALTAVKWALAASVKGATGAFALFGVTLGRAKTAQQLAAEASAMHAAAMRMLGGETVAAGGAMAGLRGKLNSSALGTAINGVSSKLGMVGLLGAAFAVGVAIGSWIDHLTGFSDKAADFFADLMGVNDELEAAGGRSNRRGIAPGEGGMRADGTEAATAPAAPQVVTPHEAAAREVRDIFERHSTEKVDVTIKDKTNQAEVKRGRRPAKGASVKLRPSGAF